MFPTCLPHLYSHAIEKMRRSVAARDLRFCGDDVVQQRITICLLSKHKPLLSLSLFVAGFASEAQIYMHSF